MDAVTTTLPTVDDLMKLGSDARVEVVNGEIVEMTPVGALHHFVAGNIQDILKAYVTAHESGYVFMDGLIYLLHRAGPGIKGARVPDVSYVRKEHFPHDWNIEEPMPGAPDLAVEVVSPKDSSADTLARVRDYLSAGTEEVWVVYPQQREVHQYRRDIEPETVRVYKNDERIDAESLFPGLELITSAFFVLPDWVEQD